MKIKLSTSESNCLIELLYLGNWLANSNKHSDKKTEKYELLFYKVYKQLLFGEPDETDLYNRLIEIIEYYNNSMLFTEFARHYAEYKYPINKYIVNEINNEITMQYAANSVLKSACEKELQTNGFKNINVMLPDLSDEMKDKFESLK